MRTPLLTATSALYGLFALASPALAQSPPTKDSDKPAAHVSEIVVTAQRRAESAQTVPIAITAMSGKELEARGVASTLDVVQYIPNMVGMNNTGLGSSNTYYIRGLGSTESIATFDPPVGTYLDDVYISRQGANNFALFDVDRIEVLRGPQGTLFGRNTTGGAVSVHMAEPSFDGIHGFGEAGYGTYHKKTLRGSINVPLSDTFAVSASGYWQNDDGYVKDVTTGERLNDSDGWGARLAMKGELSPSATWTFGYTHIVDDSENILNFDCNPEDTSQCNGRYATTGFSKKSTSQFADLGVKGEKAYYGNGNHVVSNIVTSKLSFDVAPSTKLELITGYVRQAQKYGLDFYDGRAAPSTSNPYPTVAGNSDGGYILLNDNWSDQFSQEVKLNGSAFGGLLDYVTGVYYMSEDNSTNGAAIYSGYLLQDSITRNSTETFAGYAQGDLNLTGRLKLTAGIRWTDEVKKVGITDLRDSCSTGGSSCLTTANLIANGIPTKLTTKMWTPRFAVNYQAARDVLLYVSATKGFRSGGWSARATTPDAFLPFGPEKVWSYEAGIKSQWFDNRVRANVTFYWEDVSDLQTPAGYVTNSGSLTFITRNFADYRNRGIEAEFEVVPTAGLNLHFSGGYQDDKYIIDRNAATYDEYGVMSVAAQQASCLAGTTSNCGKGIVTADGSIATPVRTPDFTVAMGGSYEIAMGNLSLVPSIDATWRSSMEVQTSNVTIYYDQDTSTGTYSAQGNSYVVGSHVDPLWLFNAGLALNGPDHAWQLSVNCQNCTNKVYGQSYLGYTYINPPRTVMAKLRYNF